MFINIVNHQSHQAFKQRTLRRRPTAGEPLPTHCRPRESGGCLYIYTYFVLVDIQLKNNENVYKPNMSTKQLLKHD